MRALDHALDDLRRLALIESLLGQNLALLFEVVGRHFVAAHELRVRGGDVHDEVMAQRLHFIVDFRAGQLNHDADAAAHVVVGIHHAVLSHKAGKAAHGNLFANGSGRLRRSDR